VSLSCPKLPIPGTLSAASPVEGQGKASVALQAGVNVKVVQERLGHFSPGFTLSVYAHATPDMQADAAATFAGLVLGGRP
jgi:hypothetical protein